MHFKSLNTRILIFDFVKMLNWHLNACFDKHFYLIYYSIPSGGSLHYSLHQS